MSFAPSATAVGHCDRVRITCESNPVRHSVSVKRLPGQSVFAYLVRHFQDICLCLGCSCIRLQSHSQRIMYACMYVYIIVSPFPFSRDTR